MTYAITGSTGPFGATAIRRLLDWNIPAASIIAVARNEGKAASLKALGVQVRLAAYEDGMAMERALKGADRLLLVSGSELGKRIDQHRNVIEAAMKTGVKFIVYTSIARANTTSNPLAGEHVATEALLKGAGIPFAVARNNWYTENYANDLKQASATGSIEAAAGAGRICSATRSEYAEAAARILTGEVQTGKVYELAGEAWDYEALARAATELLGKPVVYMAVGVEERKASLVRVGLPPEAAAFVASLEQAVAAGTLSHESPDLALLLGRKPKGLKEGLAGILG